MRPPSTSTSRQTRWAWIELWIALLGSVAAGCGSANLRTVTLYCAQDQVFAEPILARFTEQSGIRVRAVYDSEAVKTVGLANRLLAERDRPACDVFWGNEELRTRQLAAQGVFASTNGWMAFGQRTRCFVIRNAPGTPDPSGVASLAALTNELWRGRVSLAFPLFGTTATHLLALRQHWGEPRWREWCGALAANRPFIEEGNSQVVQRVARGEAAIGLTDSDDIRAAQREGKPVRALAVASETLVIPNTIAVTRSPPHPEAARRLYEYLQSAGVRDLLVELGALDPRSSETNSQALHPNWDDILRDLEPATGQLKAIFRR